MIRHAKRISISLAPLNLLALAIAGLALQAAVAPALAQPVRRIDTIVAGIRVTQYEWRDSRGLLRTVALKKQGNGNLGNGGYAVRMTYQALGGRTIVASATAEGFGYFVSHERERTFTNGAEGTIAGVVFHTDDSPLGSGFPVVETRLTYPSTTILAHRFTMFYPRYGTIDPIPKDANGDDVRRTPTDPIKLRRYVLPVKITWVFQSGRDFPRIQTSVSLAGIPGPDRVNFDVRGPYGVLDFDNSSHLPIASVLWGDRYHFTTLRNPVTRNAPWRWSERNFGARYAALVAGAYEIGFVEPTLYASSALVDGYSEARGLTSTTYNNGRGCPFEPQLIPCDWEWPYQSAQYSLPYNNRNASTTYKKFAWGSAPFYGAGPSLPRVFDSPTTSRPFNGFPASKTIAYSTCLVLGLTIPGGLTRSVARSPNYNCAVAVP